MKLRSIEARWRVTAFLSLAAALNFADRTAMSVVLPALRTDLGISDVSLGLLGSVFLWSYALGSPLAGLFADRYSRSTIVVGSLVAWSAVTALMGLVNAFPPLLGLRFGLGFAECFFMPAAIALIASHHGPTTRARAMSCISIGVNGGLVLGGTFAGFLAEHLGWRSCFWALGLGGIVLAFTAKRSLSPGPDGPAIAPTRASLGDALRYLMRVPTYYILLAESMLSGAGLWIFLSWLPLYFREAYHLNLAAAGFAGTFMLQVSVVLGIAAGGWISDRIAGRAPHRRMLLYSISCLVAAPFLLLFLNQPQFIVVAAAISAFSFLRGLGLANHNPTQCEVVPPQFRSTGVGIMNAAATGSGGCGVLLAGFLKHDVGLGTIFAGTAGAFALGGLVLFVGYRFFIRADIARAQGAIPAVST